MYDFLAEIFVWILQLFGSSADGMSERNQAQVLFVVCGLFGLIIGCSSTEFVSKFGFGCSGACGVMFLIATYWGDD